MLLPRTQGLGNKLPRFTDDTACNFDETATQDDGSCDYCSCASEAAGGQNGFNLSVETYEEGGIFGMTTYRVYVTTPNETDFLSAIAGDEANPSYLRTSTSFYQNDLGGATADMINPLFFGAFPELAYDSWLTIGIESAPMPGDGTAAPQLVQAEGDTWLNDFEAGNNLEINSFFVILVHHEPREQRFGWCRQEGARGSVDHRWYLDGSVVRPGLPEGVGANEYDAQLRQALWLHRRAACNYNDGAQHDDGSASTMSNSTPALAFVKTTQTTACVTSLRLQAVRMLAATTTRLPQTTMATVNTWNQLLPGDAPGADCSSADTLRIKQQQVP